jgi:hypothetical protein
MQGLQGESGPVCPSSFAPDGMLAIHWVRMYSMEAQVVQYGGTSRGERVGAFH